MAEQIPDIIKDLSGAVTASVRVQNRQWLALAVASVFVLVPRTGGDEVMLPLGLPEVPTDSFALVALLILSVLTVAFSAAQSRSVRVANFAHRVMDDRAEHAPLVSGHDERDYFDALREPSLGQVASLAQVFEGASHFRVDPVKRRPRRWSTLTYLVFKVPSLLIWLVLPAAAEAYAIQRFVGAASPTSPMPVVLIVTWFLVAFAVLSLGIAAWLEVAYIWRVVRRMNGAGGRSI